MILGLAAGAFRAAAESSIPIRVAYAGSMGAVMDQQIGPAFAKAHAAQYQGIGQASYALAHLLESKQRRADDFVSVTPGRWGSCSKMVSLRKRFQLQLRKWS
jgi:molybdate/tungstate transport system substrate-binding protein